MTTMERFIESQRLEALLARERRELAKEARHAA